MGLYGDSPSVVVILNSVSVKELVLNESLLQLPLTIAIVTCTPSVISSQLLFCGFCRVLISCCYTCSISLNCPNILKDNACPCSSSIAPGCWSLNSMAPFLATHVAQGHAGTGFV